MRNFIKLKISLRENLSLYDLLDVTLEISQQTFSIFLDISLLIQKKVLCCQTTCVLVQIKYVSLKIAVCLSSLTRYRSQIVTHNISIQNTNCANIIIVNICLMNQQIMAIFYCRSKFSNLTKDERNIIPVMLRIMSLHNKA